MGCGDERASGGYLTMRRTLLMCALAGVLANAAPAAEKSVDGDFLEFLGSLDSEDDGWHDYLEKAPVKTVGKVPVSNPPAPDAKQVKSK
jgi:hypothetical protein